MRGALRIRILVVLVIALACSVAPAAHAAKPCFAEVWYTDQTRGHTYEYLCGRFRLHAGQIVNVPVRRHGLLQMMTARVIRISTLRTYFGGPLRTVAGVR